MLDSLKIKLDETSTSHPNEIMLLLLLVLAATCTVHADSYLGFDDMLERIFIYRNGQKRSSVAPFAEAMREAKLHTMRVAIGLQVGAESAATRHPGHPFGEEGSKPLFIHFVGDSTTRNQLSHVTSRPRIATPHSTSLHVTSHRSHCNSLHVLRN